MCTMISKVVCFGYFRVHILLAGVVRARTAASPMTWQRYETSKAPRLFPVKISLTRCDLN